MKIKLDNLTDWLSQYKFLFFIQLSGCLLWVLLSSYFKISIKGFLIPCTCQILGTYIGYKTIQMRTAKQIRELCYHYDNKTINFITSIIFIPNGLITLFFLIILISYIDKLSIVIYIIWYVSCFLIPAFYFNKKLFMLIDNI